MNHHDASTKNVLSVVVFLFSLVWVCTAAAQYMQVYPVKNEFLPGEPITVAYRGVPGTGGDWVTIVRAGAPADEYGQWIYIEKGDTSGILRFDGLSPGRYEVRLYLNWPAGGYNVVARQAFTVESGIAVTPNEPRPLPIVVYTRKETYYPFEPITVNYQDLPGNEGDWLTIVSADAPDNNPGQWRYTGGRRSGVLTFIGRPRGRYEVRVYLNWPSGGYNVAARQAFWVQ